MGAAVGLVFFVAAISFLLASKGPNISLVSLVSGTIVETLAGINFWLYGRTSKQLEFFHSRLEQGQRFILANSVCENLAGETKQSVRAELVRIIATSIANGSPESTEGGVAVRPRRNRPPAPKQVERGSKGA